jgi:hypothetical protein
VIAAVIAVVIVSTAGWADTIPGSPTTIVIAVRLVVVAHVADSNTHSDIAAVAAALDRTRAHQ